MKDLGRWIGIHNRHVYRLQLYACAALINAHPLPENLLHKCAALSLSLPLFPLAIRRIYRSLVVRPLQTLFVLVGFLEKEDLMDGGGEIRCWEELIPDALELIFSNLSFQDLLTVVPMVCKSWGKVASGPHIWQEIDILEWSRQRQHKPDSVDRMLRMLITRSCGSFRKLSVCSLSNDPIFSFIADHAGSLKNLQVSGSDISDSIVELVAGRLSNITSLDISFCEKIGSRALEAIGQNCKSLVELWRRRDPTESDKVCQDDEAHAIATTMPKIKRLNMGYCLLTTRGVLEILSKCSELEFLDVTGCWDVELDEAFLKEKCASLKVRGPHIECQARNLWEGCSDYSDSSGYLAWEYMDGGVADYDAESFDGVWDDDHGLEGLELRFYEGLNDAALGLDWPPSP